MYAHEMSLPPAQGVASHFLDNCAAVTVMPTKSIDTYILNGYLSKAFLKRVKSLVKTHTMSDADVVNVCLKFNIFDSGQDDYTIAMALSIGVQQLENNLNNGRWQTSIHDDLFLVMNLCGFDAMCNVSNAMACGSTIGLGPVVDEQNRVSISVTTQYDPMYSSADVDRFKGYEPSYPRQ